MKRHLLILLLFTFPFLLQAQEEKFPETAEGLLQKLIQFRAFSGKEKEISIYFESFCKSKGLYTKMFVANDSAFNFTASLFPLDLKKPNIIFTSHLDVVEVFDTSAWRTDPFDANIINDTLYGRGSIDCLGLAVMQVFSLLEYKKNFPTENQKYNFTFLAVVGEEVNGQLGAKFMVDNFLAELNAVAVFGEGGSGMNNLVPSKPELEIFGISVAEKSSLWLRLDVNRKTHGHGSVPPDLYANKRLLKSLINLLDQKKEIKFSKISRKMFKELGKLEGGMKGFVIKHINWTILFPFVKKYFREGEIFHVLVENTFVITDMGTLNNMASNQISSGAYAVLDCRLLPGTDIKKFIRKVQFAVGLKVDISIISESPNSNASEITPFFENMQSAIKEIYPKSVSTPILFPASTDNNFFRLKGIPTYGIIPCVFSRVALEGVHGDNEYIPVKDIYKGISVYQTFIMMNQGNFVR